MEIWRPGGQEDWGFFMLNGLLWKEDARLCVPAGADRTKMHDALGHPGKQMHDALGHPGKHRTLARVLGSYYWRGAYSDTLRYVRQEMSAQQAGSEESGRRCARATSASRAMGGGTYGLDNEFSEGS